MPRYFPIKLYNWNIKEIANQYKNKNSPTLACQNKRQQLTDIVLSMYRVCLAQAQPLETLSRRPARGSKCSFATKLQKVPIAENLKKGKE